MDVNDPQWEAYEAAIQALIPQSELVKRAEPALDTCRYYLCLYGENGLTPEVEFAILSQMTDALRNGTGRLKRLEVETSIWQDVLLFMP
jgi:hypothetical protein